MKNRQCKKNLKGLLTKEELIVLELYRKSYSVDFYLHDCKFNEAYDFANITRKEPVIKKFVGINWLESKLGKIKATAFLKEESQ
jgi:hypothetical protein